MTRFTRPRPPVLVGMDVVSTYCYLLEAAEHCDETTWGVHLLELRERGLRVDYTIADAGSALRAGQQAAWGEVPCHGDIFHPEKSLHDLCLFLAHRAQRCTAARQKIVTFRQAGMKGLCGGDIVSGSQQT